MFKKLKQKIEESDGEQSPLRPRSRLAEDGQVKTEYLHA